jgi:hypothetical protein
MIVLPYTGVDKTVDMVYNKRVVKSDYQMKKKGGKRDGRDL